MRGNGYVTPRVLPVWFTFVRYGVGEGAGAGEVGPLSQAVELRKLVEEYCGALLVQGYNADNVASHGRYISRFITHVDTEGRDIFCVERNTPKSVDHGCLLRWMQAIRLTGVKEYSLQANKTAASGFYKWLIRIGKAERNPIEMLAAIKLPEYLPKPLAVKDTEKILASVSSAKWAYPERNQAMLEVLYASGIRRRELINLDLTDLAMDDDPPHFLIRQGKGKRDGIGMLTPSAIEALRKWLPERAKMMRRWERPADYAPLFLTRSGKRMDYFSVGLIVESVAKGAIGKRVTPHQFRHSFCTDLLNNGANLMSIKELARHKNLTTTQRYLSVSRELLKKNYAKHPGNKPPKGDDDAKS